MSQITARRAAVRPRVQMEGSSLTHLLEDLVREALKTQFEGVIEILGGSGMGKTTALEHLAEVLSPPELFNVRFFDEPDQEEIQEWTPGLVHICTKKDQIIPERTILSVKLVGWSEDDAIEYLLSKHHDQCGSVMGRINGSKENQIDYHLLVGCPRLVSIVLDRMARDETVTSVKQCIRDELSELITDANLRRLCGEYCLDAILQLPVREHKSWKKLQKYINSRHINDDSSQFPFKLLRHLYIQRLLAAEELVREVSNNETCLLRNPQKNVRLVVEAARLIEPNSPTEQNLEKILSSDSLKIFGKHKSHALAASLLHMTGRGWRPRQGSHPELRGAILHGIQLSEEDLSEFDLSETVLCDAKLMHAKLNQTSLYRTNLVDADLSYANLEETKAQSADLRRAELKNVWADGSDWTKANLNSANLEDSSFLKASFIEADLSSANFTNAMLSGSFFMHANIEGTNFTRANLNSAQMEGLELDLCDLTSACFDSANLNGCHLEGVNLPDANFKNANLKNTFWTDSILPRANFQNAILRGAGLAGIEWEGADLRGADLRESTFHMGSSRSGLVDSFLASEGTRTGFYTDEYEEQHYKSPEEIRKANLRGADLRGAIITGVDFYLVDLRDAKLDVEHWPQLEKMGAILFDRE